MTAPYHFYESVPMFKTILLPTDGSLLSNTAIDAAIKFAANGAKLIALSVAEPYPYSPLSEGMLVGDANLYQENMVQLARANVQKVADAAKAAGVECETVVAQGFNPYEEIINTAITRNCDVIFMASHGRKGLNKLFVGSETQKVLAHSVIPVLVFR